MAEFTLDVLVELRLEKAFAKRDLEAIRTLLEEEREKALDAEAAIEDRGSELEMAQDAAKEATTEKEEAEEKLEAAEKRIEELEGELDKVFELVAPFIKKKTKAKIIREIWEIIRI